MGILVEIGPMFSHAQLHFMVLMPLSGVIFILNFADAIPKVVKKPKPRSSGWGARKHYTWAKSLFSVVSERRTRGKGFRYDPS